MTDSSKYWRAFKKIMKNYLLTAILFKFKNLKKGIKIYRT